MALCKFKIRRKIGKLSKTVPITVYKTTDSTNTQAKSYAEKNRQESAVFIASEQTAGRGRLGRSFISERGKGLYLSILLGNGFSSDFAISLTTYMAVIASRAVEALGGVRAEIKWVNDVYVGGRKLAGILTEGKASNDGESLEYAVVGIGINLLKQDFDADVKNIATTLEDESGKKVDINSLAAMIIREFFENLDKAGTPEIAAEYKARSLLIGEDVTVIKPTESYTAHVKDINEKCELILSLPDGSEETLSTGEVSVRKINR
jgi:BirA family biotin operon repressor/biotin-[acetyl-CoA-carboxylase] ligase